MCEELLGLGEGFDEHVDVGFVVVDVYRRPARRRHAELAHQRLGAVVPGAHAHAVLVEDLADVVRVDPVEQERHRPAADRDVARTVDGERVGETVAERVEHEARQSHLVVAYRVHAERRQVFDGRTEPDRFDDRLGARFELPRHVVRREPVEPDVADHLAATEEGRHRFEQLEAGPQRTDAARPEELVRRERHEVGVPGLHVGLHVRHELTGVDEHQRIVRVCGVCERPDLVDRPEHVRHRADRQELRTVEQLVEVREVEAEVVGERDPPELDAALGREHVPRHDVGVVLHVREHDGVAGLQVGAGPRVRDEVDRFRRVADEHDLLGLRRADEVRRPCAARPRTPRSTPPRSSTRRGGCWRSSAGSSRPSRRAPRRASATTMRSRGSRAAGR